MTTTTSDETKPRIYLAGPMTRMPDFNYPAFHAAAADLRAAGYEVANPAETDRPAGTPWVVFMADGITALSKCTGVALLPGWTSSIGATTEHQIACRAGLTIQSVDDWLEQAASQAETLKERIDG